MKELKVYAADELSPEEKLKRTLLVCDEGQIRCETFRDLQGVVAAAGMGVVLAMPDYQYTKGTRGFAKAQILAAVSNLDGVMLLEQDNMPDEVKGWRRLDVRGPVVFANSEVIFPGNKHVQARINETDDIFDMQMIYRAKELVKRSNCWLDPAGCVVSRTNEVLVEATSTSFNQSNCLEIPFDQREMNLNLGERLRFCDSLHAERVAVSQAAGRGISLAGSTAYVTKYPCRSCAEELIGAGAQRVVFEKPSYGIVEVGDLFDRNGISVARLSST